MNIALGTAQFGMNYGITNQNGKTEINDLKKILLLCQHYNININLYRYVFIIFL